MYNEFGGTLSNLALAKHRKSRAINAENPRGEKGKGGMAASDLGPSRKGSPCLRDIASGQTVTLAEIEGPGAINHIWITVDAKTTDADCFVLRDLVLRMYWDDEEEPSVESPLGDFFCCGFGRECNVNSMPIAVVPSRGLNCYFQMPFRKKARITLENQHANPIPAFFYQVDYCLYDEGLPIIFTLQGLDEDMLVKILKEPRNAILKQYEKLLEMDEVKLEFEENALRAIAKKALEKDTGARALRAILEEYMLDIMYEIPKDDSIGEVIITKEYIEHTGGPKILLRGQEPLLLQ